MTTDCEDLSNGPDKKESTDRNEHVGKQKKFKQQILWSLRKAAFILILNLIF